MAGGIAVDGVSPGDPGELPEPLPEPPSRHGVAVPVAGWLPAHGITGHGVTGATLVPESLFELAVPQLPHTTTVPVAVPDDAVSEDEPFDVAGLPGVDCGCTAPGTTVSSGPPGFTVGQITDE